MSIAAFLKDIKENTRGLERCVINPKETITVGNDGQATLSAPNRGYSIWVLKMEI